MHVAAGKGRTGLQMFQKALFLNILLDVAHCQSQLKCGGERWFSTPDSFVDISETETNFGNPQNATIQKGIVLECFVWTWRIVKVGTSSTAIAVSNPQWFRQYLVNISLTSRQYFVDISETETSFGNPQNACRWRKALLLYHVHVHSSQYWLCSNLQWLCQYLWNGNEFWQSAKCL